MATKAKKSTPLYCAPHIVVAPSPEALQIASVSALVRTACPHLSPVSPDSSSKKHKPHPLAGVTCIDESLRPRVVSLIDSLLSGQKWKLALEQSGLQWRQVSLWEAISPDFKAIIQSAEDQKARILIRSARDSLFDRGVEGIDDLLIGRIGKDEDGVLTDRDGNPLIKKRYSDKLTELALRLDPAFNKATTGGGGTTVNGDIVYNLQMPTRSERHDRPPVIIEATETASPFPKTSRKVVLPDG